MRAMKALIVVAMAACSTSSSPAPDASAGASDLSSCGKPVATTAPATIVVSGTVVDGTVSQSHTVAGAQIEVRSRVSGESLGAGVIGNDGTYSIPVATGERAVDAEIEIDGSGYARTLAFPAAPLAADTELPRIALADSATLAAFGATAATGTLFVMTHDCSGQPVGNVEIALTPAGGAQISYGHASGAGGLAVATNVTPGSVVVAASFGNVTYREHAVDAAADAVSFVEVAPR